MTLSLLVRSPTIPRSSLHYVLPESTAITGTHALKHEFIVGETVKKRQLQVQLTIIHYT